MTQCISFEQHSSGSMVLNSPYAYIYTVFINVTKGLEKIHIVGGLNDFDSDGQDILIFNKKLNISDIDGHWTML